MRFLLAFSTIAVAVALAGCGGDLKCGAGTHEENGLCVQTDPVSCDLETSELIDGKCVGKAADADCAPGTIPDPQDPSRCLPDCGPGTTSDPVTHKCVPTLDLLEPDFLEQASSENNDPLTDGTPIDLTLPAEGGEVIAGGVIGEPRDDADYGLVADFDGWKFTTTTAVLLEITGIPVSHIRFAFILTPADDPHYVERLGFNAEADQESRQVWVPYAGDWIINVSDADNVIGLYYGNTPVGADDVGFSYAFSVQVLPTPAATELTAGTEVDGNYAEGAKLFSVEAETTDVVEFWSQPTSDDLYPIVDLYAPLDTFVHDSSDVTLGRSIHQPLYFMADYWGTFARDFRTTFVARVVAPEDFGALSAPVTKTGENVAAANDSKYYSFVVSDGAFLEATATVSSTSPMYPVMTVYDGEMNPLGWSTLDATGLVAATRQFVQGTGPTEYVMRVNDAYSEGGTDYTFDLALSSTAMTGTVEVEPNEDTTTATATDAPPVACLGTLSSADDVDVYKITLAADGDLSLETLDPTYSGVDTNLTLLDAGGNVLAENDDIDIDNLNLLSAITATGLTAGDYYVQVDTLWSGPGDYQLIVLAQ